VTALPFAVGDLVQVRDDYPLALGPCPPRNVAYPVGAVRGDYIRLDGIPLNWHAGLFRKAPRSPLTADPVTGDPEARAWQNARPRVAANECPKCWAPLPCAYHITPVTG